MKILFLILKYLARLVNVDKYILIDTKEIRVGGGG